METLGETGFSVYRFIHQRFDEILNYMLRYKLYIKELAVEVNTYRIWPLTEFQAEVHLKQQERSFFVLRLNSGWLY